MHTPQPYLIILLAGLISMAAPAAAQTTTGDMPTVRLTLADAEARALGRNPTLAQARLSTELADYGILQSRTAFTLTFSTSFEQRSQTTAGTSQLTGGAQVVTDNTSYQSGVAQLLPWGGRVSVDFGRFGFGFGRFLMQHVTCYMIYLSIYLSLTYSISEMAF